MKIPYGTRYLLLTCAGPADRQFRGIAEACSMLARTDDVHHLPWDGEALILSRRRTLRWVVVSGHGAERTARVSDGHRSRLLPRDLTLPPGVDTLSRRIFGLLHSGVDDRVAGICLALLALLAAVTAVAAWLAGRWGRQSGKV